MKLYAPTVIDAGHSLDWVLVISWCSLADKALRFERSEVISSGVRILSPAPSFGPRLLRIDVAEISGENPQWATKLWGLDNAYGQ